MKYGFFLSKYKILKGGFMKSQQKLKHATIYRHTSFLNFKLVEQIKFLITRVYFLGAGIRFFEILIHFKCRKSGVSTYLPPLSGKLTLSVFSNKTLFILLEILYANSMIFFLFMEDGHFL